MVRPSTNALRQLCVPSASAAGAHAFVSTSQSRKIRMPMASAFRKALSRGIGARMRPSGRPRKMVNPAMAPRRTIWLDDKGGFLSWQAAVPGNAGQLTKGRLA